MRNIQESKLAMYNAVISYCDLHMDIIESMPALSETYKLFKETVAAIMSIAQQEAQVISGITTDKKKYRKALIQQTAALAAKIFAYATSVNNNELKEKVDFSVSALSKLGDDELLLVCTNIMQIAVENLVLLAPYNITTDSISNLNDFIADFAGSIPRSRNAVSSRSAYIKSLKQLHQEADIILKNRMDKMVLTFVVSQAEFFDTYTNNRTLIEHATKPTQIKGIIKNSNTGEVLSGVLISIAQNGMTATTDQHGKYVLKTLANGTYSIKITKEGFLQKIITGLFVKLGQTTTIDIALEPAVSE